MTTSEVKVMIRKFEISGYLDVIVRKWWRGIVSAEEIPIARAEVFASTTYSIV